jgi:hypothetical protein
MGTPFTKLRLFFRKASLVINALFPRLRETLYACRLNLFAEAFELFTHAVSSRRRPQNGVLRSAYFRGPNGRS